MRKLKRAAQSMVDILSKDESAMLDTGGMGLAVEGGRGGDLTRPRVALREQNSANQFIKGKIAPLTARCPENGSYRGNSVNSCHPSQAGIQPADFTL